MEVHRKTQHLWCTRKRARIKNIAILYNIFAMAKNTNFQNAADNILFFGDRLKYSTTWCREQHFLVHLLCWNLSSTTKPFVFVQN